MRKCIAGLALLVTIYAFSSCASMKNLFGAGYSVPVKESVEVVREKADRIITEKSYLRKFDTVDKMDRRHTVFVLDEDYISIDGVLYAYRFNNIMYYGPTLAALNERPVYSLPDKAIGLQGYASPVESPDAVVSFIFARKLFAQKGYASMLEASRINGVSFSAPNVDDGYIDDFGRWHRYTYYDYFENIFRTRGQDVRLEMYQSLELKK